MIIEIQNIGKAAYLNHPLPLKGEYFFDVVKRMSPSSNLTVDVSTLTKGLYILEGRVGNKISVEKLSIN